MLESEGVVKKKICAGRTCRTCHPICQCLFFHIRSPVDGLIHACSVFFVLCTSEVV
jgi:hypothetical protein